VEGCRRSSTASVAGPAPRRHATHPVERLYLEGDGVKERCDTVYQAALSAMAARMKRPGAAVALG
jgi:hypothetical protein